jgi:hypothetical protein
VFVSLDKCKHIEGPEGVIESSACVLVVGFDLDAQFLEHCDSCCMLANVSH